MADGTYRVMQSEDGTRTLYLFPPDGSSYRSISSGSDEPEEESDESGPIRTVCVTLNSGTAPQVLEWSPSVFDTLLDGLGAAQRQSKERGDSNG